MIELPAEGAPAVFDDAVGRAMTSEIEQRRIEVGIRLRASGVLRDFARSPLPARITAIDDIVMLLRVGMAVVFAGGDQIEPVVLGVGDVGQGGRAVAGGRV